MKNKGLVIAATGIGIVLGSAVASARSYNPLKWIKKSPGQTANEELAANKEEERKLTLQLQALLPPKTTLRDACSGYLKLEDCVAALHVSRNVKIKFNCLKWDMIATRPSGDVKSCEAPPRDKALPLDKAIHILNLDVDAKAQAKSAERRAREDIKDATS